MVYIPFSAPPKLDLFIVSLIVFTSNNPFGNDVYAFKLYLVFPLITKLPKNIVSDFPTPKFPT